MLIWSGLEQIHNFTTLKCFFGDGLSQKHNFPILKFWLKWIRTKTQLYNATMFVGSGLIKTQVSYSTLFVWSGLKQKHNFPTLKCQFGV